MFVPVVAGSPQDGLGLAVGDELVGALHGGAVHGVEQATPPPVWGVELRDMSVELTGYALRDGSPQGPGPGYLRSWALDASTDGVVWRVAAVHRGDDTLRYRGAVGAWQLAEPAPAASFFRVRLLGPSSRGEWGAALGALELFGRV